MTVYPGFSFRRRRARLANLGPQHHPDGTPMHPQLSRDRLNTGPLSMKRLRLLVPGLPPFVPKLDLGRALCIRDARAGLFGGACRIVDSAHRLAQARMLGVEESLDRICHIRAQRGEQSGDTKR